MKDQGVANAMFTLVAFVFLLSFGWESVVHAQTVTPTVSPTATATPIPTASPTPAVLITYDQALKTYGDISAQVIGTADRVLEIMKWVVAGIFSILTVAGGAIVYISRSVQQAKDSSSQSALAAEESKTSVNELNRQVQSTLALIQTAESDIRGVREQTELLHRDLGRTAQRLVALADVDTYALRFYSTSEEISRNARNALVELSKDDDPVTRFKCIQVFGLIAKHCSLAPNGQPDPMIIRRLQELATDPESLVRVVARDVLEQLSDESDSTS